MQEPDKRNNNKPRPVPTPTNSNEPVEMLTLEEVERRHVLRVLKACNGNRTDAAKVLGLDRKTLYRKLLRWNVSNE